MTTDPRASSDAELFAASAASPRLFGEIFDRHAPEILRYLSRRIGAHEAEDLVSQTFLTAFERRETFGPTYASARPWLYGIASNLLLRHRRDEVRFLRALAKLPADPPGPGFDDATAERVDAAHQVEDLAGTLAELTPGDRDVLLLVAWAHLSHGEVATALAIPVGTVKSRLHRARRIVRASLDQSLTTAPVPKGSSHG